MRSGSDLITISCQLKKLREGFLRGNLKIILKSTFHSFIFISGMSFLHNTDTELETLKNGLSLILSRQDVKKRYLPGQIYRHAFVAYHKLTNASQIVNDS